MSIELVKSNQYGERFSSRNVDDEIQRALTNPGVVKVSDTQEVRHLLPVISEVLFERKGDEFDPLPIFSIRKALTPISTSEVEEVVSTMKSGPDGLPVSEVIFRNIYHGNQINEAGLGIKTPDGGRAVYKYSADAA